MTLIEERYELVKERLQDMLTEQAVSEKYTEYFHQMAEFGLLVMQPVRMPCLRASCKALIT